MKAQCIHCLKIYHPPDGNQGKRAFCPKCHQSFIITPFVEPIDAIPQLTDLTQQPTTDTKPIKTRRSPDTIEPGTIAPMKKPGDISDKAEKKRQKLAKKAEKKKQKLADKAKKKSRKLAAAAPVKKSGAVSDKAEKKRQKLADTQRSAEPDVVSAKAEKARKKSEKLAKKAKKESEKLAEEARNKSQKLAEDAKNKRLEPSTDTIEPDAVSDTDTKRSAEPDEEDYTGIKRLWFSIFIIPIVAAAVVLITVALQGRLYIPALGRSTLNMLLYFGAGVLLTIALLLIAARLINIGSSAWWTLMMFVHPIHIVLAVKCFVCPQGYRDNKKLDRAGKIWLWFLIIIITAAVIAAVLFLCKHQGWLFAPEEAKTK